MEISPDNLDSIILSSGISWDSLVSLHNKNHSYKEFEKHGMKIGVNNVLMFIRSLSRVYIDAHISRHKSVYSLSEDEFQMVAAGSTNITSDYDVTLIGPKAAECCRQIINTFTKYGSGHLPEVADSNIYIGPAGIIYPKGGKYVLPEWLTIYKLSEKSEAPVSFFPIPKSDIAIAQDKKSVMAKYNKERHGLGIKESYDKMAEYGDILDTFYYSSGEESHDESLFWETLANIGKYASEAYVGISTILGVVVKMQMKREISLETIHYQICALENICDLRDHAGFNTITELVSKNNSKDIPEHTLLKYSKYLYRIWYSLYNSGDLTEEDKEILGDIEYVVGTIRGSEKPDFKHPSFESITSGISRIQYYTNLLLQKMKQQTAEKRSPRKQNNKTRTTKTRRTQGTRKQRKRA